MATSSAAVLSPMRKNALSAILEQPKQHGVRTESDWCARRPRITAVCACHVPFRMKHHERSRVPQDRNARERVERYAATAAKSAKLECDRIELHDLSVSHLKQIQHQNAEMVSRPFASASAGASVPRSRYCGTTYHQGTSLPLSFRR